MFHSVCVDKRHGGNCLCKYNASILISQAFRMNSVACDVLLFLIGNCSVFMFNIFIFNKGEYIKGLLPF